MHNKNDLLLERETQTERQRERDRQTDRQIDRQTDRQTEWCEKRKKRYKLYTFLTLKSMKERAVEKKLEARTLTQKENRPTDAEISVKI